MAAGGRPAIDPKLPCLSTSGCRMFHSWAMRTSVGIDHAFAVRVVVAARVARDLGTLDARRPGAQIQVVHGDQNPPLRRLQPVAHVGQRSADNHAHRVRQIAFLQLLLDGQIQQPAVAIPTVTTPSTGSSRSSGSRGSDANLSSFHQASPRSRRSSRLLSGRPEGGTQDRRQALRFLAVFRLPVTTADDRCKSYWRLQVALRDFRHATSGRAMEGNREMEAPRSGTRKTHGWKINSRRRSGRP